ncbi:PHP domain-containing protein [Dethiosulfovibrio salsuginis]|uniref:Polymerase/histidinol phosphatase N-terminal domain-containing protein n=1 Tax=Dethiosulfovibrio salsuginis TaxID=561720 RepID=A0A1X7L888_9BACT|nr:PHP domain-containing protein [Dethiosulfovibrio salsuginis]SMG49379.1 hypothetical protein SAMN06275492_1495 [Dethiosulfovibrio salsuginis]
MLLVDLHLHSDCSDGTETPENLALMARRHSIAVASLTDHDTVEGVPSFLKACKKWGVKGLSGVELSAEYPSTMHILGYGFDPSHDGMCVELENLRRHRDERNLEIIERLRAIGLDISIEDVLEESKGDVVARPHVARAMIRKGYSLSMRDCFERYLKRGAPGYVSRKRLSPERSISLIREAGGVPVLAHPIQTSRNLLELKNILFSLKEMGLWGLECLSRHHEADQIYQYMAMASDLGLHCTAGSDYHGSNRIGVSMGVPVAEDLLPWARLGISL